MKKDILHYYESSRGSKFRRMITCVRAPSLHAVIIFRFGHWLLGEPLLVRILLIPLYLLLKHRMMSKWGILIDAEARIGERMLIIHYGGIFIGPEVVIGDDVSISHNVTLGWSGEGNRRGQPIIGNNVYIASGANVSGKIRIGNNTKIGANAVVSKNVPDNSLVQAAAVRTGPVYSFYGQKDRT